MRLLTFQARRFAWKTFSRTLPNVPERDEDEAMEDVLVAFMHIESRDEGEGRARAFRKTLKHIKWIANKRSLTRVVLHSFTHLGGENAAPDFAAGFIDELAARLSSTGYEVKTTPFGYFCSWNLDVYGDSLAKVFKEF